MTTNNLLTRVHSEIPSSLAPEHYFSQDTIGEFPVGDPARQREMMSWVLPVSSIKILCFEIIGSGLPGFTFFACYARTHARTHTYTHAQIHKSAHKSAHMHEYIHANKDTPVRACVRERDSVCVCAEYTECVFSDELGLSECLTAHSGTAGAQTPIDPPAAVRVSKLQVGEELEKRAWRSWPRTISQRTHANLLWNNSSRVHQMTATGTCCKCLQRTLHSCAKQTHPTR